VGLEERLIAEIVGQIRSVASPRRILIFGSAAVGSLTPDSDIVMTTERFDETKGVVGTIAYPADRQGQVVYEAA
jgi:predicted nucleotidyltransferase